MSRDGYLPPGTRQSDIDRHHDGPAYGYEPPEDEIPGPGYGPLEGAVVRHAPQAIGSAGRPTNPDAPEWKSRRHR